MMQFMCKQVVVFDLDDTLYKEMDYLKSAYREIAGLVYPVLKADYEDADAVYHWMMENYQQGRNVFDELLRYPVPYDKPELLQIYREHKPTIALSEKTVEVLEALKKEGYVLGLITDGRFLTQRNKIEALGLDKYIEPSMILISEETGFCKPSLESYQYVMGLYPGTSYVYVGDNPKKDFYAPNQLGWMTICLKNDG
jgi:putative hydrolase of the HAD superfamily